MTCITIGQYLINRLKEIEIDVIFGVPGDFNMTLLDIIEDDPDITWGNNANELNASYAADGYARIRGVGALITTFGVGELSAFNGIAGSYSEMVPVIHIVGAPSTKAKASGGIVHHSLGDGNFDAFLQMSSTITCASTLLKSESAMAEIDRVISKAVLSKRPGYIAIPADLICHKVEVPETIAPLLTEPLRNPPIVQSLALNIVTKAIRNAKFPIIVVDGCVVRQGAEKSVQAFIERSGFPTYVTPMGKGAVDEYIPAFRGLYGGQLSFEATDEEARRADLVIEIGSIRSDYNTAFFSTPHSPSKTISLHSFSIIVFNTTYQNVSMNEFIPLLTQSLPKKPRSFDLGPRAMPDPIEEGTQITHNYFWNILSRFMEDDGIVCTEAGCTLFASLNMESPRGTKFISQVIWCSIGYSVGAAVGAAMAAPDRRVYLIVGDGSFQMSCQEVSLFLRHGLTPVILLLNNNGYLVEKLIHGPNRSYNNFQMWNYGKSLDYFGGRLEINGNTDPFKIGFEGLVSTRDEFEVAMQQTKENPNQIHFIEVVMPQFDAPREIKRLIGSPSS
ncbi:pyruvate decarboxylase PdcB [Sporodiniella umbellata]|nr:pyruvate decarboxylase PdcB [Sporodiniella umbellata]